MRGTLVFALFFPNMLIRVQRPLLVILPKIHTLELSIAFHASKTCVRALKLQPAFSKPFGLRLNLETLNRFQFRRLLKMEESPSADLSNLETTSRKALLQYLVRMGSFTSAPKILNDDTADNDLILPTSFTWDDLRQRCKEELSGLPPNIYRNFYKVKYSSNNDYKINESKIRIMQWNILSQALAISSDKFVACPLDALSWCTRRWRLLEEMVSISPDILCFQEVDHYQFFKSTLGPLGFRGVFFPKPDSPCFYIAENNGPDGCAIFINEAKFDLLDAKTRSLEVWGYQSNQVAILCKLRRRTDNNIFWVATTHLKARQGHLLATMRREQGKDLMDFIKSHSGNRPVIVTGDFNANPSEPVYHALTKDDTFPLDSAYRYLSNKMFEPPYTTWKIREDGEYCQTLDYIFYTPNSFDVESILHLPTVEDIGEGRVPSYRYPSDHFSLVVDLVLNES